MNYFAGRVVLWKAPQDGLDELGKSLARLGFQVQEVDSLEDVRAAIQDHDADLVVTRLCGCFRRPLELLAWLEQVPWAPPVLIVTGGVDVPLYLEAMRRGAFDCVGLPLNENELARIVTRALEARQMQTAAGGRK